MFYNEFNVVNSVLSLIFILSKWEILGKDISWPKFRLNTHKFTLKNVVFFAFFGLFYHIIRLLIKLNFGNKPYIKYCISSN